MGSRIRRSIGGPIWPVCNVSRQLGGKLHAHCRYCPIAAFRELPVGDKWRIRCGHHPVMGEYHRAQTMEEMSDAVTWLLNIFRDSAERMIVEGMSAEFFIGPSRSPRCIPSHMY